MGFKFSQMSLLIFFSSILAPLPKRCSLLRILKDALCIILKRQFQWPFCQISKCVFHTQMTNEFDFPLARDNNRVILHFFGASSCIQRYARVALTFCNLKLFLLIFQVVQVSALLKIFISAFLGYLLIKLDSAGIRDSYPSPPGSKDVQPWPFLFWNKKLSFMAF